MLMTVLRVSRSCELFPERLDVHLLRFYTSSIVVSFASGPIYAKSALKNRADGEEVVQTRFLVSDFGVWVQGSGRRRCCEEQKEVRCRANSAHIRQSRLHAGGDLSHYSGTSFQNIVRYCLLARPRDLVDDQQRCGQPLCALISEHSETFKAKIWP